MRKKFSLRRICGDVTKCKAVRFSPGEIKAAYAKALSGKIKPLFRKSLNLSKL
jgi:hypothetical protein